MKLLVDIGNTRLKWIVVDNDLIIKRGHFLHNNTNPVRWGERLWGDLKIPQQCWIANVAGIEITSALTEWMLLNWQIVPEFVHPETDRFGVINGYDKPLQLGVDRWIAMIGAHKVTAHSSVIIDCGTAVTIDALNNNGRHLGGIIVPGLRLMHDALYRRTSDISPEEAIGEATIFGTNTQDCIWGGTVYALAAMIDRVSKNMAAQLNGDTCALLTGGNAEALLPYLEQEYCLQPDLIFTGLRVIADFQQ